MLVNLKTTVTAINQSTLPFNNGCSNQWFRQESDNTKLLSARLTSWLFDENSLTQRLISHCDHFEVIVLREGIATVTEDEQRLFKQDANIRSREVLLMCDGEPQVYARTLIPQSTLDYADSLLKSLGNTSLGEVLFQADNMQRQPIETTEFSLGSSMSKFAQSLNLNVDRSLWARRSIFTLDNNPLMVSEVFLPNSYAYAEASK